MRSKKVIIPGAILGLLLGVSAFWYVRIWRVSPIQPRVEGGQRTESGLNASASLDLNPSEATPPSPKLDSSRPEATESAGGKNQQQGANASSRPLEPISSVSRRTGTLSVNAQPWAKVRVDGIPSGETPLELELPVGWHRVVLVYEKHEITRKVLIKTGSVEHLTYSWSPE
jgi:hypothetical protein